MLSILDLTSQIHKFKKPSAPSVVATLLYGPEQKSMEIIEENPERAVLIAPKCFAWELYNDYEVEPELRPCELTEQAAWEEGHKAINSKIVYTVTKMLPWGDPYCEEVYEFKDE